MVMLKTLSRVAFDSHCRTTVPSHAQTEIAGKQTTANAQATMATDRSVRSGASSVMADRHMAQALGFTHWKAAACRKVIGRLSASRSAIGAAVAIFNASQSR